MSLELTLLSRIFRLIAFDFVCLNLNKSKYFQKEEEKTTKKKKKVLRVAGRSKNARLFRFFIKMMIETKAKLNRKKNRNTCYGLAVLRCAGLAGRPAKFEFLFWLGVMCINLQNNGCNLTKVCGQKACVVTVLEWSDWMG